jgi:hypothetical protein
VDVGYIYISSKRLSYTIYVYMNNYSRIFYQLLE